MREVATKTNAMGMGIMLPTSPIVYSNKGDYRIGDSLTETGPILLDVPNGWNELVMAAHSTQSISKLYPIVGLCKKLSGITLQGQPLVSFTWLLLVNDMAMNLDRAWPTTRI